jgi:UTP--glucose-1-phosphate uridylyltransferase
MRVRKAVITAAGRNQRPLPLQTLVDQDGVHRSVLAIIAGKALRAGIEEICVVVCPGDEAAYAEAAGDSAGSLRFVRQEEALGYGHALHCARGFVAGEPFLHMMGDHVYVSSAARGCVEQVLAAAQEQACSVSAVQPTREGLLPYFGAVGGTRAHESPDLYVVERVLEKPSPTEAERTLRIPGLRAGHYLCFFGLHVLTPTVMDILGEHVARHASRGNVQLSPVLNDLAGRERYLAIEARGWRYPVDVRYGLLTAQLALALSGRDRAEVLSIVCDLLAQRELAAQTGEVVP